MTLPRLYPILDTRFVSARGGDPQAAAEAMLAAGCRILQLRHKGDFDRAAFGLAERIAELCARRSVLFIVNDRSDIAMLLGAGVHLGQEDLPPGDARQIMGERAFIGHSTHNESQLRAAAHEPVDYLAFGPVYATASKANPDPVTGTEELRRIRALTNKPVVAIGGISRANAREVLEAGADSIAVISDLCCEGVTPTAVGRAVEQWLEVVDGN